MFKFKKNESVDVSYGPNGILLVANLKDDDTWHIHLFLHQIRQFLLWLWIKNSLVSPHVVVVS